MNKAYSLWYIDELVERIRNTEHKSYPIGELRNYLSEYIDYFANPPFNLKDIEKNTSNALEEFKNLYPQLINVSDFGDEIFGHIEKIADVIVEQPILLRPLTRFCSPRDSFEFLDYYLENFSITTDSDTEARRTLNMIVESLETEDSSVAPVDYIEHNIHIWHVGVNQIKNDLFDAEDFKMHNDHSYDCRDIVNNTLEKCYEEREKGKQFRINNEEQEKFINHYGEKILDYMESRLIQFLEALSELQLYYEDKNKSHLEKADCLAFLAHVDSIKYRILMKKFLQAGEREEEMSSSHLNMDYPFIKELSLREDMKKTKKKTEIIRLLSFFNVLSDGQIEKISPRIKLRRYKGKTVLFNEGDWADELYIIKSGEIEIYKELNGNIRKIITLVKGDMFGEMGVITDSPRSLPAKVSSKNAELYVISKHEFLYMMKNYPELSLNLAKILCRRIDHTTRRLIEYLSSPSSLSEKLLRIRRKIEIIRLTPLFAVLSDEYIQKLSSRIKLKRYQGDRVLFNEGDRADDLYIIKSGEITLYKERDESTKSDFAALIKGDILGEMGVILESTRSLSARVSSEKAELYVISKHDFLYMMMNYPELSLNLAKILCKRLFECTRRM